MGKRTLELDLFGHRLSVATDAEAEQVREVVDLVNRRLESVREHSRRVQTDQIALLAALNMAEELLEERHAHQQLRRSVRERSRKLLGSIDAVARQVEGEPAEAT